jgi:hypothetical protein
MPDTGSRHPRPAFVEDWDDDAQTTLSSSRATANVAVKRSQTGAVADRPNTKPQDGSDSGYSSKAATVGSASTTASKMAALKIDTSIQERERHPYHITAQGGAVRRESFTRPSAAVNEQNATQKQPFVHPRGMCVTCDYFGQHVEPPQSAVQPPTPTSPKVPKKSAKKIRDDSDPKSKRISSTRDAYPSKVSQSPAVQPIYSAAPYSQTPGWTTPVTPMVYTYATPVTTSYVGYTGQVSYFEPQPSPEARPVKPTRRPSIYGEPIIKQPPRDDRTAAPSKPTSQRDGGPTTSNRRSTDLGPAKSTRDPDYRPTASIRRDSDSRPTASVARDHDIRPTASVSRDYDSRPTASVTRDYDRTATATVERNYEPRPVMSNHRSNTSVDQDRIAMPPPEKPKRQPEVARRPSIKKSATYTPEIIQHRRSRTSDEYDPSDAKMPPSPKARGISPSRPPSSYRGPPLQEQAPVRPQVSRKSVSYSDPVANAKVAQSTSSSKNESVHRRTTNPVTSMEQKTAEAEAYQRQRSKMTSEELTLEKLEDLKKQSSHTRSSETGSAYSHKESHHSSSKDSSGRGRSHTSGHRTSIILEGGPRIDIPSSFVERKGRPVSINIGDLTISMGPKEKARDTKLLEKASSVTSQASKHSIPSATYDEPSQEREHDEGARSSGLPSQSDDRRRPVTDRSQRSSRQHSRAPSSTRASRRQSVDHSGR